MGIFCKCMTRMILQWTRMQCRAILSTIMTTDIILLFLHLQHACNLFQIILLFLFCHAYQLLVKCIVNDSFFSTSMSSFSLIYIPTPLMTAWDRCCVLCVYCCALFAKSGGVNCCMNHFSMFLGQPIQHQTTLHCLNTTPDAMNPQSFYVQL